MRNRAKLPEAERKERLHADRIAGGDRDYCDSGGDAAAGAVQRQGESAVGEMHEQQPADHAGLEHVCH